MVFSWGIQSSENKTVHDETCIGKRQRRWSPSVKKQHSTGQVEWNSRNMCAQALTKKIGAAITDHKAQIRANIEKCIQHYQQGLSQIDRSQDHWKLKPSATIEDLHSWFVQALECMERTSSILSKFKDELNTHSRYLAAQSTVLSEDISKTNRDLKSLKATLASVEKDKKKKQDDLNDLERQLDKKREELDKTKKKHDNASKAAAGALGAAVGFLIFAPFSVPALVGAGAADATAFVLVSKMASLKKDIESLWNRIDASKEICRLTSQEFDKLKDDKTKLESEEWSKERKMKSLKEDSENVRKMIADVSRYLQDVKACCTALGVIVNKFETLKEESDPEYCINLSVLRTPVQELEESMQQEGMITF